MNNKPIKSSYSILLMRDDNAVSTFRLRAFWFKVAVTFLLLLILSCAAAIYGLVYYHGRYQSAAAKREELKTQLSLALVELQERKNLAILPGSDPASGNTVAAVNSIVQPYRPHSGQPDETTFDLPPFLDQGGAGSAEGDTSTQTAGSSGATDGGSPVIASVPAPEDAQSLLGQSGPVTVAGLDQPVTVPEDISNHPVKVSNVATSFEAGGRLKVNFDIANQPQRGTLAGVCSISARTRQGAEVALSPVSSGSLSFRIERYRRMQAMMILPDGLDTDDIFCIEIRVQVRGLPLYWSLFELKR